MHDSIRRPLYFCRRSRYHSITSPAKISTNPTARVFAPDHRVMINYASNKTRADELLTELHQIPSTHNDPQLPRFHLLKGDVGDEGDLQNLVRETMEVMGRLDVVVSNGGWTRLTNFTNLDENVVGEDWDKCFKYNVKSHLFLMHAARKHLEDTQGAFLLTTSIAGVKPSGSSLVRQSRGFFSEHHCKTLSFADKRCRPTASRKLLRFIS